jgi:hypothetical protein
MYQTKMKKDVKDLLFPVFKSRFTGDTLAPLLFYTLAAVVMTWPLVLKMNHSVVGHVGDNYYFVWLIDWFKEALFQLHQSPFFSPFLNYPEGYHLAHNAVTPAMVLIALPFCLVGGAVFGYNMSMLISFVLSGFGAYLFVYRVSKNKAAALIAGTIFAFVPYRMAHLMGHLNLMGTQWLPFYFLYLYELLCSPKASWKSAIKPALFLGLIAFTSIYYLLMSLVITLVFLFFYLVPSNRKQITDRRFWKKIMKFTAIVLPLLLLALLPFLVLSFRGQLPSHPFAVASFWSASPTDFIRPSHHHFLWGDWVRRNFDVSLWVENNLYVGFFALLLAVLAFVKRRKISGQKPLISMLFWTGCIAFILALGTNLYWLGKPVTTTLFSNQPQMIPMPGLLLYKYLPFYSNMRIWMRYGIFVHLFVSVLAGLGSNWLLQKVKPLRKIVVTSILLTLILVELLPTAPHFSRVTGRPVDYWLAGQRQAGAVAEFPFIQNQLPQNTFYTMIHKKPFIGAMGLAFPTTQQKRIQPILKRFPHPASLDCLRRLGVTYIIVDKRKYKNFPRITRLLGRQGVPLKKEIGFHAVFLLPGL